MDREVIERKLDSLRPSLQRVQDRCPAFIPVLNTDHRRLTTDSRRLTAIHNQHLLTPHS